jgi:hypothetical protein
VTSFGGPEILVVMMVGMVLGVVPLALNIWAIIDAAGRPDWAWERSGQNKTLWIVLIAIGLVFCALGLVMSIVYFVVIRPQVVRAEFGESSP